jgi:hypothetical protein
MSRSTIQTEIIPLLFVGFILFVLWGIIYGTTRIGFRLGKVGPPKMRYLFAIAFLQLLLGVLTIIAVRAIDNNPVLDIGTGLGVTFLSGLLLLKLMLKNRWKESLRVWAIAAAMQLVLLPICAYVMAFGLIVLMFWLHPPQF